MDEVLGQDLTSLLARFPREGEAKVPGSAAVGSGEDPNLWVLNDKNKLRHEQTFNQAGPEDGKLTGGAAKGILVGTGLP